MSEQKIVIADADLRKGAEAGMDEFLKVFTDAYIAATGGVINAETMPLLNGMQHTLLGYHFFREEINEGGFIQLIQNLESVCQGSPPDGGEGFLQAYL